MKDLGESGEASRSRRGALAVFSSCALTSVGPRSDFNLLLLAHGIRFQFLNFAVLFDEIVEQHRHRMAGRGDLTLNAVPPLAPTGALTELESRCKTQRF